MMNERKEITSREGHPLMEKGCPEIIQQLSNGNHRKREKLQIKIFERLKLYDSDVDNNLLVWGLWI